MGRYHVLSRELAEEGVLRSHIALEAFTEATSVRLRDGAPTVADGPFERTEEHLGGYFLVEVENRDRAIAIAKRIPGAEVGTVEVRPVIEDPRDPPIA
jgi:hypothetical protein